MKHKCLGVKGKGHVESSGKTAVNCEMEWKDSPLESSSDIRKVELVQHHDSPDDENATDGQAVSNESEENVSVTELCNV